MPIKKPFNINSYQINLSVGSQSFTDFWVKCSKIEKTYGSSEYSDGQSNIVYNLPGAVKYSDVTLSKPFTPGDENMLKALIAVNSNPIDFVTASIQPMYRDGYYRVPQGGIIYLEFCTVGRVTPINEIDTGGSGVSMFEVQLYPGGIKSDGGNIQWWKEPEAQVAV
ncbi:tail tube protein [Nostoc phage N1]|nr:tail tube protein [Nostoc phage N1]